MPMQGLTAASLKKHPALIPLFACVAAGCAWSAFYISRLMRGPDVRWFNKSKGTTSNSEIADPTWQMKFYSPVLDYKSIKYPEERPRIEEFYK